MSKTHSFHIPVMGIGFTIDTPLKVSHLGIDSVISLVDDVLLERLRKMYSSKHQLPYEEIDEKTEDFRSKRITSYLNLINKLATERYTEFKNSTLEKGNDLLDYFHLLPENSSLKAEFKKRYAASSRISELRDWVKENMRMGKIDVNIMSKIDKENFDKKGEKLPIEYNDAHAAIRGVAESDLDSTVILSAGMNPRLYSYLEQFDDFYPDENGYIKKKIALKVSDYRSALIQGKFLAKKGIWVSEYRIESGLNCGGHAFATDGFLMGPILAEFRDHKAELIETVNAILKSSLEGKGRVVPAENLQLKVTAQGGVGTAEEHEFLLEHYNIDCVGWGTPFLLVPEATNLDKPTVQQLIEAKEENLYLSGISPLGVPFNNLKGNSKDVEKQKLIDKGRPGSSCPKKYLVSNKEYTEKSICTASRQYQFLKLKELDEQALPADEHQAAFEKITTKSCICVGLGTSALIENDLDTKKEGPGVSVCPGPNMAYFSKKLRLKQMIGHIYGRENHMHRLDRPNMFVKELSLYLDYFKNQIAEARDNMTKKQEKYLATFASNMEDGIAYYQELFGSLKEEFNGSKVTILKQLDKDLQLLRQMYASVQAQAVEAN